MPVYGFAVYGAGVYGGDVQITLGGGDVSSLIRVTDFEIDQVVSRRGDTAKVTLLDATNSMTYAPLTTITIKDTAGNTKFAGLVTILKQMTPSPGMTEWYLTAQDYSYYLDATLCNKKYQGMGIDAIVKDLLASFPPQQPITTNNVQSPLPSLAYFNANHLSLSAALDKLVSNADSDAYLMWDVDANKDLHFFDQNHVPSSGLTLTDLAPTTGQANYRRDTFYYQRDASQMGNSVTFRGATYLSNAYTQHWTGDGVRSSFLFDYPPDTTTQAGGALPVVTIGGVAQTVATDGGSGFGGVDCLVSVSQDSQSATLLCAAAPGAGVTIAATYAYDVPVLVRRQDNQSVIDFGTWQQYVVDTNVKTQQAAIRRAGSLIGQFGHPLATSELDVHYEYVGPLGAGQTVTLINSQLGLNLVMIVQQCKITGVAGGYLSHHLTLATFS